MHTHFTPGPADTQTGLSRWAPVIVSPPVIGALLADVTADARQLAPWTAQLPLRTPSGSPLTAWHAETAASQWLQAADAATRPALHHHPPTTADRALLESIPADLPPPRQLPHGGETIARLCAGSAATADRLRYLTPTPTPTGTRAAASSASWQRTAHAAAIIGHTSQHLLTTLATRARQLAINPVVAAALDQAAAAAADACTAWRHTAHHWDTLTTDTRNTLTPAAAEMGDLVLWTGRLAHENPR